MFNQSPAAKFPKPKIPSTKIQLKISAEETAPSANWYGITVQVVFEIWDLGFPDEPQRRIAEFTT
jgi:hypothetical protein